MPAREYETREINQTKNKETSSNFLLGIVIGGLAGAAAALLFAPKSGKELRNTLNTQTDSLMERTSQLRENMASKSSGIVSKSSSFSQGLLQQSTDVFNKAKHKTISINQNEEEEENNFIPLGGFTNKNHTEESSLDHFDVRRKLEEASKALEEEENKVKQ